MVTFILMFCNRREIDSLLEVAATFDRQEGTITTLSNLGAKSRRKSRRPSSIDRMSATLAHITHHFEQFKPSRWFMKPVLLVARLMQTSLIAIAKRQTDQAAIASCVALCVISLQGELAPFRLESDNHIAFMTHCLILQWTFVLLLYIVGTLDSVYPVAVGVFLLVSTVAVIGEAARSAVADAQTQGDESNSEEQSGTSVDIEGRGRIAVPISGDGFEAGGGSSSAGSNANSSPPGATQQNGHDSGEGPTRHPTATAPTSSPWHLLGLCAAQQQEQVEVERSAEEKRLLAMLSEKNTALISLVQVAREQLKETDETKFKNLTERMLALALFAGADPQGHTQEQEHADISERERDGSA